MANVRVQIILQNGSLNQTNPAGNKVINDSKTFEQIWSTVHPKAWDSNMGIIPFPPLPEIDFEKNTILAISLGAMPNPISWASEAAHLTQDEKNLTVRVKYTQSHFATIILKVEGKLDPQQVKFDIQQCDFKEFLKLFNPSPEKPEHLATNGKN